jgi:hypothetical protein
MGLIFKKLTCVKQKNLSFDQLSKVKTLRTAKLEEELLIPLQEKYLLFLNNFEFIKSRTPRYFGFLPHN